MTTDIGTTPNRHGDGQEDRAGSEAADAGDRSANGSASPITFGGGVAEVVSFKVVPAVEAAADEQAPAPATAEPDAEPDASEPAPETAATALADPELGAAAVELETEASETTTEASDTGTETEASAIAEPETEAPAVGPPAEIDSSDPGALRPSAPRPVELSRDEGSHRLRATLALVGLILAAAAGAALVVGLAVAALALGLKQLAG